MERTFEPDKKQLSKCTNQPTNLYLGFFEMFTQQLTIIRLDRNLFKAHSRRLNLKRESPCSTDFLSTFFLSTFRFIKRKPIGHSYKQFMKYIQPNLSPDLKINLICMCNTYTTRKEKRRQNSLRLISFTISESLETVCSLSSPSIAIHSLKTSSPAIKINLGRRTSKDPKQNVNRWIEDDIRRRAKHISKRSDKA
ncbi:unnamed protein product [Brassica oleracea]|uniref:(rape) hypothetical protein n=1 Tax=Brassica napus TaxID=3708 RepID=A0A816I8H2_BRANA|nr:unnamed protein product [Brassica napus]